MGNFEGQILFYTDAMTMPEQIRKLLMDPSIVKVGSSMFCELKELLYVDIRVRGWVNSGAILRAFLFNHTRTGLEAQCSYLNSFGLTKGKFSYICYQPCWEGQLRAARHGGFCKELKQHMAMNVIVPLAISLVAVLKFATDKKLSVETWLTQFCGRALICFK